MSVVILQVFVSLMLVASSVLLFLVSVRQRDHEHADRLSLIPLEDEQPAASSVSPTAPKKEPLP
jgi:hypothetical protein